MDALQMRYRAVGVEGDEGEKFGRGRKRNRKRQSKRWGR
jgi:hypothetical protein